MCSREGKKSHSKHRDAVSVRVSTYRFPCLETEDVGPQTSLLMEITALYRWTVGR